MGVLPGNLVDKGLEFRRFVGPGEGPAHVAGGVPHIGTNTTGSSFLIIRQGLYDQWDHYRQT